MRSCMGLKNILQPLNGGGTKSPRPSSSAMTLPPQTTHLTGLSNSKCHHLQILIPELEVSLAIVRPSDQMSLKCEWPNLTVSGRRVGGVRCSPITGDVVWAHAELARLRGGLQLHTFLRCSHHYCQWLLPGPCGARRY